MLKLMSLLLVESLTLSVAQEVYAQNQTSASPPKYGLYLHFGISTFQGYNSESKDMGRVPPEKFAPTGIDARGWARTAKQAGMDFAILTVKHEDGFCLWPAKDYEYHVGRSPVKIDIVAEYVAACKTEGITPGVHYSIPDAYSEGKALFKGPLPPAYFETVKKHITDLHTKYPGIRIQVFDVAVRLTPLQFDTLRRIIKQLNQSCIVNPAGDFGYRTVNKSWFWSRDAQLAPALALFESYSQSATKGSPFILNVGVDQTGHIPDAYVDVLMEVRALIGATGAAQPSLTPEQVEEMKIGQQGFLAGIGANLRQTNGHIVIFGIMQNSPAEGAGLMAGEVITTINGIPAANMALADAIKLIRGPKGSKVDLVLGDPTTAKSRRVTIVRDNVALPPGATGRVLDGGVGLLTVTAFSEKTPDNVGAVLRSFATSGVRGVVMDLRGNGGGSLSSMIEVAGLFVGQKPTLFIQQNAATGMVQEIHATGNVLWQGPVAVLVDGMTANAGELIASAFQTSDRAQLIGQKTYGMGTSTTVVPQSDGSAKRVVAAYFLTARGDPINGKGITPDVALEANLSQEEALRKAVAVLSNVKSVSPHGSDIGGNGPTEQPAGAKATATERMKLVKELYDTKLISKEDHDKKVKEIMDSL